MSYSTLTEAVDALRGGNQSAFQDVYDGSCRYIYYTILKSVQDKDIADDILQETYIEIFKNISSLKEPEAFKGWAAVIAQNKISRHFRKKSDTIFTSEEEMDSVIDGMETDNSDMLPEDAADNMETQRLIMDIINTLPEAQKAAVISFYYNQMSITEISTAMEVPENTVKTWLSRGKKKIKDGVIELERKHGTKLYTLPFVVVISGLFSKEAEACELPAGAYAAISAKLSAEATAGVSAAGAAGKAGMAAAATATKSTEIFWGIIAAVAIGASVAGAAVLVNVNKPGQDNSQIEASIVNETDTEEMSAEGDGNLSEKVTDKETEETEEHIYVDNDSEKKETESSEEKPSEESENTDEAERKEEEKSEVDEYEIPEVIAKLEKGDPGILGGSYAYRLGGVELFFIASGTAVEDKGDYYEVPQTDFVFYDESNFDPEMDDVPMGNLGYGPVTVRVRKDAVVVEDLANPGCEEEKYEEMSAEDYFSKMGRLSDGSYDSTLRSSAGNIEFDDEGYITGFDALAIDF